MLILIEISIRLFPCSARFPARCCNEPINADVTTDQSTLVVQQTSQRWCCSQSINAGFATNQSRGHNMATEKKRLQGWKRPLRRACRAKNPTRATLRRVSNTPSRVAVRFDTDLHTPHELAKPPCVWGLKRTRIPCTHHLRKREQWIMMVMATVMLLNCSTTHHKHKGVNVHIERIRISRTFSFRKP